MSKKLNEKYYNLDSLKGYENSQYFIIFGERGNGKSYAVTRKVIDDYFLYGKEFVIMKRYEDDIKPKIASTMLNDHLDYIYETYGYKIRFYGGKWLAYKEETKGKLSDCLTIGYALSINNCDKIKGSQFPLVENIIFEEFMSMTSSYLSNEVNLFLNVISTIVRNRTSPKVYILGNAISKFSPYSTSLGVKLHRMKKGEIRQTTFKDKKGFGTTVTIQRCENVQIYDNEENKNNVVFNNFGNNGIGKMITSGDFETGDFNKIVNNVTFFENVKHIPSSLKCKKYDFFSKNDIIPIVICFEDYYFRIYIKQSEKKYILGFREIKEESINENNTLYILNSLKYFKGITNVNNLTYFNWKSEKVEYISKIIIRSFLNNDIVFLNNDNGQDIHNAFKQLGINKEFC